MAQNPKAQISLRARLGVKPVGEYMADAAPDSHASPMMQTESSATVVYPLPKSSQPHPRAKKWLTTRAPASFDKVALVSAALGGLIGVGLALLFVTPSLGVYLISFSVFHLLEFVVTATYNPRTLGMNSFLLTNGVEYVVAHGVVILELACRWLSNGKPPTSPAPVFWIGLLAIVVGQYVRSGAMIHAATSFNHYVQEEKKADHKLVKTGLYGIMRHPSYFGFFLWEAGSQIVLGNKLSGVLLTVVLYVYFFQRLKIEEAALIRFFGQEYVTYKQQVWSGLPLYR